MSGFIVKLPLEGVRSFLSPSIRQRRSLQKVAAKEAVKACACQVEQSVCNREKEKEKEREKGREKGRKREREKGRKGGREEEREEEREEGGGIFIIIVVVSSSSSYRYIIKVKNGEER